MVHQLEAHRRHADEIGDLLLLDQPQRLARIPFRHQHHAAADDEAVEHHRHLAGDVEQRHVDQGPRRVGRRAALALHDAEQGHQADRIGIDAGRHRAVGRQRALGDAGRARGEQDGRIVLRRDLGQLAPRRAPSSGASASLDRLLDRRATTVRDRAAARRHPLRARRVGEDQLRLGQLRAHARSSSACHQPLSRVAIAAGLERPPCRRRPRPGSCAWRCRPGRPCRCRAPASARASRSTMRVELGEGQPLVAGDDRLDAGVERAEGVEQHRQGRREIGDDRPALARPRRCWIRPPGPVTWASTASNFRSSSLGIPLSPLPFVFPPYEARKPEGEALIDALLTSLADGKPRRSPGPISGCRSDRARPRLLPAALVQPRLSRRHLHRLLVSAQAARAAGRADGPAPRRRPGLLCDARHHPRRPARLRAVLQACSIISQNPLDILKLWDGGMSFHGGVIGSHARHPLSGAQAQAGLAPDPRLCRLLRAVRPVLRPPRQFREPANCGARATDVPWAIRFPEVDRRRWRPLLRPAAPSEPALRGGARGHRPVRRSSGSCSGRPEARYQPGKLVGAFILFYGLFRFAVEFVREPDPQLVEFAQAPASTWASGCRCR